MENVLDIYTAKPDPARPLVCLDEFSKQLLSEVAPPIAPRPGTKESPGQPARSDAEYVREGSASAFMIAMPHLGRREVFVGKEARRTAIDYADAIAFLCDEIFPEAEKITLVHDNLNTHDVASLYKRFEPAKARRLAAKIDVHFTPKHGSWLNMAEIEIALLSRSALQKRIASVEDFRTIVAANVERRNKTPRPINWQFTSHDARIKLKQFYPDIPTL